MFNFFVKFGVKTTTAKIHWHANAVDILKVNERTSRTGVSNKSERESQMRLCDMMGEKTRCKAGLASS